MVLVFYISTATLNTSSQGSVHLKKIGGRKSVTASKVIFSVSSIWGCEATGRVGSLWRKIPEYQLVANSDSHGVSTQLVGCPEENWACFSTFLKSSSCLIRLETEMMGRGNERQVFIFSATAGLYISHSRPQREV